MKKHRRKFEQDQITYSNSWSRTTYDAKKNKLSVYP